MNTLVIDNEFRDATTLNRVFSGMGRCDTTNNGLDGLRLVNSRRYDLVVTSMQLQGATSDNIIKKIRNFEKKTKVDHMMETKIIVVSNQKDELSILKAIYYGATDWLMRPITAEKLRKKLKRLCCLKNLKDLGSIKHPPNEHQG